MKKNKCSIQGILSVCLACLAVFAGCSGFTEDTNMGGASDADIKLIESQFASARVTQVGKAQVDKSRDSVTIVYETFGGCLKTDNGAYAYNSDFYFAESRPFAYDPKYVQDCWRMFAMRFSYFCQNCCKSCTFYIR